MLGGVLFFTQPIALLFLAVLPLLWLVFKLLPLKPRKIIFPAMVLFDRKKVEAPAPRDIPLWLKILRLALVFCFIMFLARPVYDPAREAVSLKPTLIVLDNSWSSAEGWQTRLQTARQIIDSFINISRIPIAIVTTTPNGNTGVPMFAKDLTPDEARKFIADLKPEPYQADFEAMGTLVKGYLFEKDYEWNIAWLAGGQAGDVHERILDQISNYGETYVYHDDLLNQGLAITKTVLGTTDLTVHVGRLNGIKSTQQSLSLISNVGEIIAHQDFKIDAGEQDVDVSFTLPENMMNSIGRIQMSPTKTAATTWYMDSSAQRPHVGIWSERPLSQKQDYLNDVFYIAQATQLSSKISTGKLKALIEDENISMIILPDSTVANENQYLLLNDWVEKGGTLLRFSGKNLIAEKRPQLLPVDIYGGERNFGGAMSWSDPAKLGGFNKSSPLSSFEAPKDLTIKQQVLARPSIDLNEKRWAWLEDKTPFITHKSIKKGHSILIHTSADTSWSDMVITDFFPRLMSTLARFSGGYVQKDLKNTLLRPYKVYDGYGALITPEFLAKATTAEILEQANYTPEMPAGLYVPVNAKSSSQIAHVAFNLGQDERILKDPIDLEHFDVVKPYGQLKYIDLSTLFLILTAILFLADIIASALLSYGRKLLDINLKPIASFAILTVVLGTPSYAMAQVENTINLAYVITQNSERDAISRSGLENLGAMVKRRTTVEFGAVDALTLGEDDLSFYPLIYWPMTANQTALTSKAAASVQSYLDHGGMILFDTRDGQFAETGSTLGQEALQRVMQNIQIDALVEIPKDHVLKRSYYLLNSFTGLYDGQALWVEDVVDTDYDGVPSVIIGGHDWAGAWASADTSNFTIGRFIGRETQDRKQTEYALRFGINTVLMALSGSYKKDQVHVKYILERFERDR